MKFDRKRWRDDGYKIEGFREGLLTCEWDIGRYECDFWLIEISE